MDPRALYLSDDISWLEKPDVEVEGAFVERKQWADAKALAKQVSAFANGQAPGGLVVVGVDKNGQILGLSDRKAKAEALPGELRDQVDMQSWEYRAVSVHGGQDQLLCFLCSRQSRSGRLPFQWLGLQAHG